MFQARVLLLATALAPVAAYETRPLARRESSWPSFVSRVNRVVLGHPIVKANPYTAWFARGDISDAEARDLTIQFSVFSNLFLEAQLAKVINAGSLEEMREGKEILANELGVMFNSNRKHTAPRARGPSTRGPSARTDGLDHEVVSTEGSVEGGVFRFKAGHYEWLLDMGASLGVGFGEMGRRRHGCPSTLHFCDALRAIYGSEDAQTALAASFAVENWAAAGFWDELVEGWKGYNAKREHKGVPLGFWTHHAALEAQHAGHTLDELEEVYLAGRVRDEDRFVTDCAEMLDAVQVFWDGLEARRLGRAPPTPGKDYSVGGAGYAGEAHFGGPVSAAEGAARGQRA